MAEHRRLMGGKIYVYRRKDGGNWDCSTFMEKKNWRTTTKIDSLALAKDFAEDWYLSLKGKKLSGQLKVGKTFNQGPDQFLSGVEALLESERSLYYVRGHEDRLRAHLRPFFGEKVVSEITPGARAGISDPPCHKPNASEDRRADEAGE